MLADGAREVAQCLGNPCRLALEISGRTPMYWHRWTFAPRVKRELLGTMCQTLHGETHHVLGTGGRVRSHVETVYRATFHFGQPKVLAVVLGDAVGQREVMRDVLGLLEVSSGNPRIQVIANAVGSFGHQPLIESGVNPKVIVAMQDEGVDHRQMLEVHLTDRVVFPAQEIGPVPTAKLAPVSPLTVNAPTSRCDPWGFNLGPVIEGNVGWQGHPIVVEALEITGVFFL